MKSITFFPLSPYYFKYIGLVLTLLGLGLVLFLTPQFELLLYAGLLIIVYSKEKDESETSSLIRNEAFKSAFGIILSMAIALFSTVALTDSYVYVVTPFLYIGLPLLLYLLIFNIISILKINVNSYQDLSQNFRYHRRFYIIWLALIITIFCVLVLKILI